MLKIGLTGGIGAGKTFVSKIFESYGIPVYYTDKEAKDLMYRNKELKKGIKALLGKGSYHKNGRLNRSYVSKKIFSNKELLNKMNALVHPAVSQDFKEWAGNQSSDYVIEESAIIFEAGLEKNFDAIILVQARKQSRIERVMARDELSKDQVLARMSNQDQDNMKNALADFIILNDEGEDLEKQVRSIHNKILGSIK